MDELPKIEFEEMLATEALPIALALSPASEQLCAVLEELPETLSFSGLYLLSRSIEYGAVLPDMRLVALTKRLIEYLRNFEIDVERPECLRCFAWLRDYPSYAASVLDLLEEERALRGRAAVVLGHIGDTRAIPRLQELLRRDEDNGQLYARALTKFADAGEARFEKIESVILLIHLSSLDSLIKKLMIRELLETGLTDEMRDKIKAYCLEGIRQIDKKIEEAKKELMDDPESLGQSSRVVNAIALSISSDPKVRQDAKKILDDMGQAKIIESVIEVFASSDIIQRRKAIRSIFTLAPDLEGSSADAAFLTLLGALQDEPSVKWLAIRAIDRMTGPTIASGLVEALAYGDMFAKSTAARFIGYYADAEIREKLMALTKKDDPEVRELASKALRDVERKIQLTG